MGNTHYNLNNKEKSVLYPKGFSEGTSCVKRISDKSMIWICKGVSDDNSIEYTCMLIIGNDEDSKRRNEKRYLIDGSENLSKLNKLLDWAEEKINS